MDATHKAADLDLREFNRLFGQYQQRFIRFAYSYVSDSAIAEDIVMESFTAAWERRATLDADTFAPYAMTIVKNRCLNHLRAQNVRLKAAETIQVHQSRVMEVRIATLEACDPEELFSQEARQLVDKALAELPARTREIFVRSRLQGESYKKIAADLDLTVKSVEFELSKATKTMRVALKDYLPSIIIMFYIS